MAKNSPKLTSRADRRNDWREQRRLHKAKLAWKPEPIKRKAKTP
jgi:hypothetical protein